MPTETQPFPSSKPQPASGQVWRRGIDERERERERGHGQSMGKYINQLDLENARAYDFPVVGEVTHILTGTEGGASGPRFLSTASTLSFNAVWSGNPARWRRVETLAAAPSDYEALLWTPQSIAEKGARFAMRTTGEVAIAIEAMGEAAQKAGEAFTALARVQAQEQTKRRREIDDVLREDARRFPEFATARRAAVLSLAAEDAARFEVDWGGEVSPDLAIRLCHSYEGLRGGARLPGEDAVYLRDSVLG